MTNHHNNAEVDLTAGRRRVARSRGALSGILLIVLGAWAALVPFIGPYFSFGIEPNSGDAFHWTTSRLVFELLPGAVTALAGIVLLVSASRAATLLFAWLAAISGAWLVVGFTLNAVLNIGDDPVLALPSDASTGKTVAVILLYFLGTGVVIAIVAGTALGRLSVHSIRDVRAAERRDDKDTSNDTTPATDDTRHHTRHGDRHDAAERDVPAGDPQTGRGVGPEPVVPGQPADGTRPATGGAHAADVRQDPPR